jgi:hypothetical protein
MIQITTYRLSPSNKWKIYCKQGWKEWDKIFKFPETLTSYIKRLESKDQVIWTNKEYENTSQELQTH